MYTDMPPFLRGRAELQDHLHVFGPFCGTDLFPWDRPAKDVTRLWGLVHHVDGFLLGEAALSSCFTPCP